MSWNRSLNQVALFLGTATVAMGIYIYFTAESEIKKLRGEVAITTGGLFMITSINNIQLLKD